MERLDKFLCDSGAGTRSQVKLILKAGRVTVDGKPEKDGSRKIDPAKNEVMLDGSALRGQYRAVFLMNKPEGYVTATEDPVEKTVMELLPPEIRHLDLKPAAGQGHRGTAAVYQRRRTAAPADFPQKGSAQNLLCPP